MTRLTGGRARGRTLPHPVPDGARPTAARVREALFSMVGHDLTGRTVLDAFGGAGVIGLEAWSRGAEVTVVERRRVALEAIRANGAALGATWRVVPGDVLALAPGMGPFDGVYVDPPYADDPVPILETLAAVASRWLVVETEARRELPPSAGALTLDRDRRYSRTRLWVYRAG